MGLVGPSWQDGYPSCLATHSQGWSVKPEGCPAGSLRPGVAGTPSPYHPGEAAVTEHRAEVWETEPHATAVLWDQAKLFQLSEL